MTGGVGGRQSHFPVNKSPASPRGVDTGSGNTRLEQAAQCPRTRHGDTVGGSAVTSGPRAGALGPPPPPRGKLPQWPDFPFFPRKLQTCLVWRKP